MGGFEATAAIRSRERESGTHIPIVAMTAHAMKGDRESCLRAGMDDHIAKPVRAETLYRAVEAFAHTPEAGAGRKRPKTGLDAVLDEATLNEHVGGNEQLLAELIDLFLKDLPHRLSAVNRAIRGKDPQKLSGAAHALKGALSHFAARDASEAALRLERIGRSGDLEDAEETAVALRKETAGLARALAALRRRIAVRGSARGARVRSVPGQKAGQSAGRTKAAPADRPAGARDKSDVRRKK
jgi:CheY-like chemotaxis protein